MADNVNLNYPSFGRESYLDYILPILFPEINLIDNTIGSSRLLNNAFGTWIAENNDYQSLSVGDVILDFAYNENNLNLNISFNARAVTSHDLIFNSSVNVSINHELDTWSYLATNPDLISSIGTDKRTVAQHYLKFGIDEGRELDNFNEYDYVASNPDLIPIFGLSPTEAIQHYVEFGFNEQRPTSVFNEFVYLAANLDIISLDYSSYYRYDQSSVGLSYSQLTKHAQAHYINFGYLEGRESNLNILIQALSGEQNTFNTYSNSYLYEESAREIVTEYIYFNHKSYLASNQDLLLKGPDSKLGLYHHYLFFGRGESRSLDSFDEYKYLVANRDLISSFGSNGKKATEHYVDRGFFEGRNLTPSSEFNIFLSGYLVSNPDVLDSLYKDVDGIYDYDPWDYKSLLGHDLEYSNLYSRNSSGYDYSKHSSLTHYFENGYLENRQFNSFNNSNYLNYLTEKGYSYNNYVGESNFYKPISEGWNTGLNQNFLASDYEKVASHFIYDYVYFDDSSYLAGNTDLISNLGINSKFNIFNHYINHGYTEQRILDDFDEYQYLASHHDLISVFGLNRSSATEHYAQIGYLEGRKADNFNEWGYVASYTDLLTFIGNDTSAATVHYISFGMLEGRSTDIFNPDGYLNKNSDLRSSFGNNHYEATKHYVEYGFAEGRVF